MKGCETFPPARNGSRNCRRDHIMMIDMVREVLSDTICILPITSPGLALTISFIQKGDYRN
jgi:hypothetical protein